VGRKGPLLQFPQVYFVVGGLAAACFAVIAALRTPPPAPVAMYTAWLVALSVKAETTQRKATISRKKWMATEMINPRLLITRVSQYLNISASPNLRKEGGGGTSVGLDRNRLFSSTLIA
jgi:hypothetical protein